MQNLNQYKAKILGRINPELAAELYRIDGYDIAPEEKIAAFDMDGTLIEGDIGEAVFCYLKASGNDIPLKWKDYLEMIEAKEFKKGFCDIITSMEGMNIKTIANSAKNLISSNSEVITFTEDGIEYNYPIPKPIPEMQNLMVYLKISGWKISVISSSSHISVRSVTDFLFKLNPDYVRGIKTEIYVTDNYEDLFTAKVQGTVPFRKGKAEVFSDMFGNIQPLITAGDSLGDVELLNLTSEKGLVMLCGNNLSNREFLKNSISKNLKIVKFKVQ